MSSYKDLDIYKMGLELFYTIHPISLQLPKHELYELGSQLRRSSESIVSNIVEGYGRRKYKQDFIRFLVIAIASLDETIDHLETLMETESLKDKAVFDNLNSKLILLSKKLINFLKAVEEKHNEPQ